MTSYKILKIYMPEKSVAEFKNVVSENLPNGWIRDTENEKTYKSNKWIRLILCEKIEDRENSIISVTQQDNTSFSVVVACIGGHNDLTEEQHNIILVDFNIEILKRLPNNLELVPVFSNEE